jgi:biopolymer transport protein ExbD
MTAVWIELGILEVKQTYGTAAEANAESLELEISFRSPKSLTLSLKRNGKVDKKFPVDANSAEALPEELQSKLTPLLAQAGIPKSAVINTSNGVTHGDVVAIMDSLRKNKILNLGLSVAPLEI